MHVQITMCFSLHVHTVCAHPSSLMHLSIFCLCTGTCESTWNGQSALFRRDAAVRAPPQKTTKPWFGGWGAIPSTSVNIPKPSIFCCAARGSRCTCFPYGSKMPEVLVMFEEDVQEGGAPATDLVASLVSVPHLYSSLDSTDSPERVLGGLVVEQECERRASVRKLYGFASRKHAWNMTAYPRLAFDVQLMSRFNFRGNGMFFEK